MSFRDKVARARLQLSGMGCFFAGLMAPKFVEWPMWHEALLAMGVALVAYVILLALLPRP